MWIRSCECLSTRKGQFSNSVNTIGESGLWSQVPLRLCPLSHRVDHISSKSASTIDNPIDIRFVIILSPRNGRRTNPPIRLVATAMRPADGCVNFPYKLLAIRFSASSVRPIFIYWPKRVGLFTRPRFIRERNRPTRRPSYRRASC